MHCQRDTAAANCDRGADYVLGLKSNRFAMPNPDMPLTRARRTIIVTLQTITMRLREEIGK